MNQRYTLSSRILFSPAIGVSLLLLLVQTALVANARSAERSHDTSAVNEATEGAVRVDQHRGFRLTSQDGNFEIGLGGRAFLDWNSIQTTSQLDRTRPDLQGHGAEIRSARLHFEGTLYHTVQYKLEYDFEGGNPNAKDVWVGMEMIPCVGQIRVGLMKEPFSMIALTDGTDTIFLERAQAVEAFAPGRNIGVEFSDSVLDDHMTWKLGGYQVTEESGKGFSDASDYDVTARVTGLPWFVDNGDQLIHLGLSYSHQFRSRSNPIRFQGRPEAHLTSDPTVDTGDFDADHVDLITPELALVYGPVSIQAEYFYVHIIRDRVKDLSYDGFYATLSIFVIDGRRPYDMREGYFGRVIPAKNFHPTKPGCGALELAFRVSELDTIGPSQNGGKELNLAAGANWYLNPNTRLMLNYIRVTEDDRPDNANGDLHIAQARVQVDF